jgi:isocitrate lyase
MPRIKRGLEELPAPLFPDLVEELVNELKNNQEAGQPMIEEYHFPRTNAVRATVIWDKWVPVSDEDRAATIRQAYEVAEGKEFSDRILLASGLTMPEAYESGLLPYRVTAALRKGDPVSLEQCEKALVDQGASLLFEPKNPHLRFATEKEADACVNRLIKALPGSDLIWMVTKEVGHLEQ